MAARSERLASLSPADVRELAGVLIAVHAGGRESAVAYEILVEQLVKIAGQKTALLPGLVEWINRLCPSYEIDTPQELAHFLAQACHETDHFRTLREYASGAKYESRLDLGNTQPGDGVRFKGRGIFQTTGRANYTQLGLSKGRRDLFVNQPTLLEQPEHAVWSACEYWKTRRLNDAANHADGDLLKKKYRGAVIDVPPVEFISITINGGYNGMSERKAYYAEAKSVLV
jgi:putative chitinase